MHRVTDNSQPLGHYNYYGLLLGKNKCKVPKEYATKAIDVELSYYDIRPYNCPKPKCTVEGDVLTYVGDDCCKTDFYHVCTRTGVHAVEDGKLKHGSTICEVSDYPCDIPPNPPVLSTSEGCECGSTYSVRLANVTNGEIGHAGEPSNVGKATTLTFDGDTAVYVSVDGSAYMLQGIFTEYDFSKIVVGRPPVSDDYCICPTDVKFLVKHDSGVLMTLNSDKRTIHISHPYHHKWWGKYDIRHCRDIIAMLEVNGNVFIFDGSHAYAIQRGSAGDYFFDEFNENICIRSEKQLAVYDGTIFAMTADGIRSITGSQYNRSVFGLINTEVMNPTHMRCLNQNWRIEAYNGRVHFANDDNAYIYNLTIESNYALTESSLVPDDYLSNCDGIYYMKDGQVYEWNPCDGELCPYTYCTGVDRSTNCHNIGVIKIDGEKNGGTKVKWIYTDRCMKPNEICETDVCLCDVMEITGCENTRGIMMCLEGFDIICNHEYATAPMELR